MIAALPMYDAPSQKAANDRLWALVRDQLDCDAPAELTRDRDLWDIWQSPDLLVAQTCGLPFRARLMRQVYLVGAPDHRLPNVPAGHYQSVVVARPGAASRSMAGLRLAFNDPLSQSGWAVVADLDYTPHLESGSHAASAEAVLTGAADIAAIDANTWRYLVSCDVQYANLEVIHRTASGPTLPFITARPELREPLFHAIKAAFAALDPADADTIGMYDIVPTRPYDYITLPIPQPPEITA